jgi:hypothetical protein
MSPEEIVDGMYDAFNAGDAERHAGFFVEEPLVRSFPAGEVLTERSGPVFRRRFRGLFESNPDLHGEVVSRVVKDGLVITQEWMSGFADGHAHSSVVLYEVGAEKIERVWLVS